MRQRRWAPFTAREIAFMVRARVRLLIKSLGVLLPGIIATFLRDVCVPSTNLTSHLRSVPWRSQSRIMSALQLLRPSFSALARVLRYTSPSNYLLTNNRFPIDYVSIKRGRGVCAPRLITRARDAPRSKIHFVRERERNDSQSPVGRVYTHTHTHIYTYPSLPRKSTGVAACVTRSLLLFSDVAFRVRDSPLARTDDDDALCSIVGATYIMDARSFHQATGRPAGRRLNERHWDGFVQSVSRAVQMRRRTRPPPLAPARRRIPAARCEVAMT